MSKKHFEMIAGIVRDAPAAAGDDLISRQEIAQAFSIALAAENPRFDRERFMKACGVGS